MGFLDFFYCLVDDWGGEGGRGEMAFALFRLEVAGRGEECFCWAFLFQVRWGSVSGLLFCLVGVAEGGICIFVGFSPMSWGGVSRRFFCLVEIRGGGKMFCSYGFVCATPSSTDYSAFFDTSTVRLACVLFWFCGHATTLFYPDGADGGPCQNRLTVGSWA